jgi:hypothetical protein
MTVGKSFGIKLEISVSITLLSCVSLILGKNYLVFLVSVDSGFVTKVGIGIRVL